MSHSLEFQGWTARSIADLFNIIVRVAMDRQTDEFVQTQPDKAAVSGQIAVDSRSIRGFSARGSNIKEDFEPA